MSPLAIKFQDEINKLEMNAFIGGDKSYSVRAEASSTSHNLHLTLFYWKRKFKRELEPCVAS